MKQEAEFTEDEAQQIILWLVHMLGGRVTIPIDKQFWEDNYPKNAKLLVDHDYRGFPQLVVEYVWLSE